MSETPKESHAEIRQRFKDLAEILKNHGVKCDYELLIDLDLYIMWLMQQKNQPPTAENQDSRPS